MDLLGFSERLAVGAVTDDVVARKALGFVPLSRLQHPQADIDNYIRRAFDGHRNGRVVHATKPGLFTCQVEATVKGVPLPASTYGQVDEARAALLDFWAKCNRALENYPYWTELDYK